MSSLTTCSGRRPLELFDRKRSILWRDGGPAGGMGWVERELGRKVAAVEGAGGP